MDMVCGGSRISDATGLPALNAPSSHLREPSVNLGVLRVLGLVEIVHVAGVGRPTQKKARSRRGRACQARKKIENEHRGNTETANRNRKPPQQ